MRGESFACADSPGRVAARLARVVEVALAAVDLTPAQYRVLIILEEGTAQASTMADYLSVSRPAVTTVVDGLVARGLVDRRQDEQDRRRVGHTITTDGRELLARADITLEGALAEILDHAPGEAKRRVALEGLRAWKGVLDSFRNARMAQKVQKAGVPG